MAKEKKVRGSKQAAEEFGMQGFEKFLSKVADQDPARRKLIRELLVDTDYEREILARSISMKSDFEYALQFLKGDDFSTKVHRGIFWTLTKLVREGVPLRNISPLEVIEYLSRRDLLSEVDGALSVETILGSTVNPEVPVMEVCNRLRRRAAERKLIGRIMEVSQRQITDPNEQSRQDMLDEILGANRTYEETIATLAAERETVADRLQPTSSSIGQFLGSANANYMPIPFRALDRVANGLQRGALYIVGARPGMGKTSLALQLARAAQDCVLFASYEMSIRQLITRTLVQIGETRERNLADFYADEIDPTVTGGLLQFINERQFWFDSDELKDKTPSEVDRLLTQLEQNGKKFGLVIVDHLQLSQYWPTESNQRRGMNRTLELDLVTAGWKDIARRHNVCVVALSQLSRPPKPMRNDEVPPRPTLIDLRESGGIEQNADQIWLLHRPEYYIKGTVPQRFLGLAEVIVDKNRFGGTGIIPLTWAGPYTLFRDREPEGSDVDMDEV